MNLKRCKVEHSVFISSFGHIIIVAYVDDTMITNNNEEGIQNLKHFLCENFQIKDLDHLQYFIEVKAARYSFGINLFQRKYVINLL